jgi:hypothetical protein
VEQQDKIWATVRSYFALSEDEQPQFHLDKPWHHVVIHSIPTAFVGSDRFGDELETCFPALMDLRGMLRRELLDLELPPFITYVVSLSDAEAARRCIRDGVFLGGTHCRVSRYDPTRRRRGGT